jgi:hypothetical protein
VNTLGKRLLVFSLAFSALLFPPLVSRVFSLPRGVIYFDLAQSFPISVALIRQVSRCEGHRSGLDQAWSGQNPSLAFRISENWRITWAPGHLQQQESADIMMERTEGLRQMKARRGDGEGEVTLEISYPVFPS